MKAKCMLVLIALLASTPMSHAGSDKQTQVQGLPDKPAHGHGSITGTVTDESGKPVSSATVELTDTITEERPSSVMTNEKGNYALRELLPGDYEIRAKKDRKESDAVNIKVTDGSNAGPELVLKAKAK